WNGRRDLRRGSLGNRRGGSAERGDDIDPQIHQFVRHCRQSVIGACRPAIFDAHVLAFDITGLAQTPNKRVLELRRGAPEYAHYRHRLLRSRRERPRSRCAAEERDEVAPLHSITSSAVNKSVGGIVRPSVLAVLRLITRSYLVGCWKGRSLAFSPRRIRSTYDAAPRYCSTRSVP